MNALTEWYGQLSERDKKVVQIAAPISVLIIIVFAVIIPINSAVSSLRSEVADNKKAVVLLQAEAPRGTQGGAKKSFSSLTNLVTSTTRQYNFKLDRFEEKSSSEISVWFDSVAFDQLLQWLENLDNDYGVKSSFVTISQTSETGIVRTNVRLTTGS
ncbi:MAG: type II secretion system protein M [Gammaproteobacteria bacterium]|nr:type II secretion system protein M [Gammaproteobacteria bacterium]NVK86807.1 type II secretion system protein M [Gammaproteobacteria bacterium]